MWYNSVMRRSLWLWLVLLSLVGTSAYAETPRQMLSEAKQSVKTSNTNFALMQFLAILREHPSSPEASDAAFASGELYFAQKQFKNCARMMERFTKAEGHDTRKIIAMAYLAQCDPAAPALELKKTVASRRVLFLFEASRLIRWRSPIGNRFTLEESVDQIKIKLDDAPFYTIRLS